MELTARSTTPYPQALVDAALNASEIEEDVPLEWEGPEGLIFSGLVAPGGGPAARYLVIQGRDFTLRVQSPRSRRPTHVDIRAEYLWKLGPERATRTAAEACAALLGLRAGVEAWRVSRADFCVDAHVRLGLEDTARWRREARALTVQTSPGTGTEELPVEDCEGPAQVYFRGRRFTGWTFGVRGAAFYSRVYLKSLQAKTHAPWIVPIWERHPNYDPEREVWRPEFEVRREGLAELGVDGIPSLFARQEHVWRYCTWRWLTLRRTAKHDRETSIDSRWSYLSERGFTPESRAVVDPAVREAKDKADLRRLAPEGRGFIVATLAEAVRLGRVDKSRLATDEEAMREYHRILKEEVAANRLRETTLAAEVLRALKKRRSSTDERSMET